MRPGRSVRTVQLDRSVVVHLGRATGAVLVQQPGVGVVNTVAVCSALSFTVLCRNHLATAALSYDNLCRLFPLQLALLGQALERAALVSSHLQAVCGLQRTPLRVRLFPLLVRVH